VCLLGYGWCARRAQDLYWFGQNVPTSSLCQLTLLALLLLDDRSRSYKRVTSGGEREEGLQSLLCADGPKDYETGVLCYALASASRSSDLAGRVRSTSVECLLSS
jgi:hypothetical protein